MLPVTLVPSWNVIQSSYKRLPANADNAKLEWNGIVQYHIQFCPLRHTVRYNTIHHNTSLNLFFFLELLFTKTEMTRQLYILLLYLSFHRDIVQYDNAPRLS